MVSEDRDDPEVVQTFALLQTLLVSLEAIDQFLQEVAELAARLQSPALSCGITVEYDSHPLTVSSSDAWARLLDETQYQAHEGPCLQAMRTGNVVHVPRMETETRWPGYIDAARDEGLHASLSLPLIVEGVSVGAVNFYSREPDQRFDSGDIRARADLFAAQASTALLLAVRQLRQSETNSHLETALTSRSVIDQAMGIIMGQQGCTPDEAFAVLRRHSQNNNRMLRDVASDLVERTSGSR